MLRTYLLAVISALAVAQTYPAKLLYQFPPSPYLNLENIIVRKNGDLLIDVISRPEIYQFDVKSSKAELLVTVPSAQAILGIAEPQPGSDRFVFAVGNFTMSSVPPGLGTVPGSYAVWTLDLSGDKPVAKKLVTIKGAGFLNGVSAVPGLSNTVLVADSIEGTIWTVNTETGSYQSLSRDPLLTPEPNLALGVNGVHVRDNFAYFTNTAQYLFGKLPISIDKRQGVAATGAAQLIAKSPSINTSFDDFAFDKHGTAWITTTYTSVSTVSASGKLTLGVVNDTSIQRPTADAFALDQCTLYVVNTGDQTNTPPRYSGSIHVVNTC